MEDFPQQEQNTHDEQAAVDVAVSMDAAPDALAETSSAATSDPQSGVRAEHPGKEAEARPSTFNIGEVLALTFSSLAKNPVFYLFLATLGSMPGILKAMYSLSKGTGVLMSLADFFFSIIFMGAICFGVYKNLTGGRVSLWEALRRGLASYLSLVGISFLYIVMILVLGFVGILLSWFGILIGVLAFFWINCTYAVVTPACVVEGLTPMKSLDRSSALSEGHRGQIFGLLVIDIIFFIVMQFSIEALFPAKFNVFGANIATTLTQPIYIAFSQVMIANTYYQLRVDKEGVGVDKLASVFD